jgi:3-hydroxyisobutyrate dehydrogenase/2-hydroxy-3-oxopropionate reductase
MTTVAVLGAGRMGSAMAAAIRRAGHELVVYNRTPHRAASLASTLDCALAATPAEAAAVADICLTMLADEHAVRAVYEGRAGLLAGARPGNVLVDSSTVPPSVIQSFEARARATGAGILDAPVSGSVTLADAGTLTLMVGGTAEDVERARAVLEAIGQRIFHLGPLGTGAAMKLAVNALIFGLNGAVAEGLVLAERAGIERSLAYDVLAASAAGAPFVGYKRASFVDPEGTPMAFSLALAEKDLRLITELGERLGLTLPQALTNLEVVRSAEANGREDRDFSFVAEHLRETAGPAAPPGSRKPQGGGT